MSKNNSNQVQSLVESLSEVADPFFVAEDLDRQKVLIKLMRHEYAVSHDDDPLQKLCKLSFYKFDNFNDLEQAFYGISLIVQSIRNVEECDDPDNILSDAIESLKFMSKEHSLLSLQEYMAEAISVIDRLYLLKGEIIPALDSRANYFKKMAQNTVFTAENYISQINDPKLQAFLQNLYNDEMPIGNGQHLFQRRNG